MPELLLELFSEEIPARMQARGAEDLSRVVAAALAPVMLGAPRAFHGPRRIAVTATLRAEVTTEGKEERGPRVSAPEPALAGFLKKHGAERSALVERNGFWVLDKPGETLAARDLIAREMPKLIRGFAWPKSMRWGTGGSLTWVRPLQRILCLLDGDVVPFDLRQGEDDAHGLRSANLTEGHRVMAPGEVSVFSFASYEAELRHRRVVLDAAERMQIIEDGLNALAAAQGVRVVPDRGLLEEVSGLVEWPVPLLGRIDDAFMDLPPELMRTTMRVNQRYFAMVKPDGSAAPFFGVVANIAANDGGGALVAGNERVLRARLSDARFFWDQDRKQKLEDFLPKLDEVVFHAKLGTQGQRVARLERLARWLAPHVGADANLAARAAQLAKADLASGMVGEFPELQGVMGRYYARAGGEDACVADAIGTQYRPLGPGDAVPAEPTAIAVALADKLDTLAGFFAADERPTGSGDPFALRRAALGIIRIIRENGLRLRLAGAFAEAFFGFPQAVGVSPAPEFGMAVAQEKLNAGWRPPADSAHPPMVSAFAAGLVDFLAERLRVQLRAEGARHDVVAAAFTAGEDDLLRLLARADALKDLVESDTGRNLLAAYKRAANILRIEEKKDGPHTGAVDAALLALPEEQALAAALDAAEPAAKTALADEKYPEAMAALAALRGPVDAFFDRVTVNAPEKELRQNRLRLLNRLRSAMDAVADFSKLEG
ncbi:glycine--tRNA ligase subunit beta [Falsiroseomonas bella]|uniref:Glycine--tRNA ligase beta subunit n=1 Tax=Falsiroseomonas bella TaxID=2184016 RepID=A0A317FJR0_9PROT|nr:glycine--tRNA ligase subunit beta [Falsiroseomonas bella]PWS37836.1 glycine--tRNA ligase subunit beta [Falsiroseomonas bella]